MTIKAILWTYGPKKDGTCSIKIYANLDGQKKYFKTQLAVLPEQFDEKKGLVRKSHPAYQLYNANLRSQILEIESHLLQGGTLKDIGKKKTSSYLTYLEQFIRDTENGLTDLAPSTCQSYKSLLRRLKEYCTHHHLSDLTFEDITLEFYDQFKRFLVEGDICGVAGFGKHIKVIKSSMRLAMDKGLHENLAFQHKLFRKITVKTNKIYLTEAEIKQLEELDLSDNKSLCLERDRFLISYYFLTRYSDSIRLRRKDFFEKSGKHYLRYFQEKTGKECVVPARDSAWRILQQWNFDLSGDTNQEANRKLKTICAMANITTPTKEGERSGPKWMFVTTHTARRSAATHLALQGVNLKIIADLGGWEKVETLRTYLRSSGLDSAEVAKDLAFFR